MKKFFVIYSVFVAILISALFHDYELINTQREVIESCERTFKEKDSDYDSMNRQWKESYKILENKYSDALIRYNDLSDKVKEYENSSDLPVYEYSKEEVRLLAVCVQCEAGDYADAPNSQKYVTQVILNRVKSKDFPNNITEVIYQKVGGDSQFTVAYNGMMDKCVLETKTLENVYEVLVHGTDLPEYVTYFYSDNVEHNWVNTLNTYCVLEGTVFAYE